MSSSGISNLVAWAKLKGAVISDDVGFAQLSSGYIGAVYDGNANDTSVPTIKVPFQALVTIDKAIEHFGSWAEEAHGKTSNVNAVLKLYLSKLRSEPEHEFKAFVDLLPSAEQIGTPYCWDAQYKGYLKGTNLGNSLKDNIALLVEEWWQVVNMIPESVTKPESHFVNLKFYYEFKFHTDDDLYKFFTVAGDEANWTSFPNYLWASLILKSRSFPYYLFAKHVKRTVAPDEAVLIPVIDLTNHNPKAQVSWSVGDDDGSFTLACENPERVKGAELYNNYGMKGNEELLLAYGFCIEDNAADSAALKIKVPMELLPELEKEGVKLPTMNDYTTAVHRREDVEPEEGNGDKYKKYEDGLLYFVTKSHIPESLVLLFQLLMKNTNETHLTLRMKLSGLNQLRQAIETKLTIIENISLPAKINTKDTKLNNISIYIKSQKQIMLSAVKVLKRQEKALLTEEKTRLISLKTVWKNDVPFRNSLLLALGVTSFDQLIEAQFLDQCWLLWLIRCFNRDAYPKTTSQDAFMPQWIHDEFVKVAAKTKILSEEVLQYQELYQGLIPELNTRVPDIYNVGQWRVDELIISAKVLDLISFTRGKEQECILVEPESESV